MNFDLENRKKAISLCCVLSLLGSFFSLIANSQAAIFTVSRFDDPPTMIGCYDDNCSLRQAIIAAREMPGSTIVLPPGTYTLTIPGLDNLATNEMVGDLDIRVPTSILGSGISNTIVQFGAVPFSGDDRIFDNHSQEKVLISNMTIRNGNDTEGVSGGCIRNIGTLALDTVMITGCESSISGGGIATYHRLSLLNSIITLNRTQNPVGAISTGGGIISGPGPKLGVNATVNIIESEISENIASSAGNSDLTSFGGGISNNATLNIINSSITGNQALNVGGIINAKTGTMTIVNSTIGNNIARFDVGGVDNENEMAIKNTTISGNIAGFNCKEEECRRAFAGGVINADGGVLTIENSTISGNDCVVGGGGVLNANGKVTISSSTIVANKGDVGAGIAGSGYPIFIKNSIVAKNIAGPSGGNLSGQIVSQGYNLFEDTIKSYLTGDMTGNIIGKDPKLGQLKNNGGPTATHALYANSPARNSANPFGCTDNQGLTLQTDQRGYARSLHGRCDIGAFEGEDKIPVIYPLLYLLLF